ncbi:uncharacterized protein PHALS_01230 [Plasmopara halstedii]|uniref:Uncharacterized protein n=1 Tax=Plasmopara halstedii TaxID=4781 RepID=A0A0P1ASD0_PLAHL|nr:uncharacterized protein PHALS_01230 [Plasmopara halstedii]CEG44903.1 hypothetical protein PHALS_01230 [Plasmopara halstedii]|eukprot:XP_024581272.1 hypothetical protein PHALS_01230 [Plasmopara halstedii]
MDRADALDEQSKCDFYRRFRSSRQRENSIAKWPQSLQPSSRRHRLHNHLHSTFSLNSLWSRVRCIAAVEFDDLFIVTSRIVFPSCLSTAARSLVDGV